MDTYGATTTAGSDVPLTVLAVDQFGNMNPSYNGTVSFSRGDGQATLPASGSLTDGIGSFDAVLRTLGSQTISATDTGNNSLFAASPAITVSGASHFAITNLSSTQITSGDSVTFTVTAQDSSNQTATDYTGPVIFDSSDLDAIFPASGTLVNGTGTFTVTLSTPGNQTTSVMDGSNNTIAGTSGTVRVYPLLAVDVVNGGTATVGNPVLLSVQAEDQFGNVIGDYNGNVSFSSSDTQALLSAGAALRNGVGTFSAALETPGSQTITVENTGSNTQAGATVQITVTSVTHFAITSLSATNITAGDSVTFSVTALDASNQTVTGYTGPLIFASSDSQAFLPLDATLTNGTGSFTATLASAGSQTIRVADIGNSTLAATSSAITVQPGPVDGFEVDVVHGDTASAGSGTPFQVLAEDLFGNVVPSYSGTVTFSSSDAQATLPANSTLTNGIGTFTATFRTLGSETITATDTANNQVVGTTDPITVTHASHFSITNLSSTSITAGVNMTFSVTALDGNNQVATDYTGPVLFGSSDVQAVLPTGATLTNGTGSFTVTLLTAGIQTISIADWNNSTIAGTSASVTVAPAAVSGFAISAVNADTVTAGTDVFLTLKAEDPYGNLTPSYNGTVSFASSDGQAILPGNTSLTNGIAAITAIFRALGSETITATDTVNDELAGISDPLTVNFPVTATGGNGNVSLTWNAVSGATSYNVYRGTSPGGEGSIRVGVVTNQTSFTDAGLTNGNSPYYYYTVSAVNASGVGPHSTEVKVTPYYTFDNFIATDPTLLGDGTQATHAPLVDGSGAGWSSNIDGWFANGGSGVIGTYDGGNSSENGYINIGGVPNGSIQVDVQIPSNAPTTADNGASGNAFAGGILFRGDGYGGGWRAIIQDSSDTGGNLVVILFDSDNNQLAYTVLNPQLRGQNVHLRVAFNGANAQVFVNGSAVCSGVSYVGLTNSVAGLWNPTSDGGAGGVLFGNFKEWGWA